MAIRRHPKPADDRRRAPRLPTELTALITRRPGGRPLRVLTKNISGTGMCLITEEPMERGTRLDLEILLPTRPQPIHCTAEVVWLMTLPAAGGGTPPVEIGVALTNVRPADQQALNSYAIV